MGINNANSTGSSSRNSSSPRDLGLTSDSFVAATSTSPVSRVIACVQGDPKTGKDHFCMTAPGPITIFNFDCGLEGVIEKFVAKGKRVIVAGDPKLKSGGKYPSYHFARPVPRSGEGRKSEAYLDRVKKTAYPVWERFISDLNEFYESDARTGIVDTGGAAFALARFAFHGMDKGKPDAKADPYGQRSGDMKAIFQGLITDGYNYDKNMLWIHRQKEEWRGNSPTGRMISDGYNQAPYETQVVLRTKKVKGEFSVEVVMSRLDTEMEGEVFVGKQCRFPVVMAMMTGTEVGDWE